MKILSRLNQNKNKVLSGKDFLLFFDDISKKCKDVKKSQVDNLQKASELADEVFKRLEQIKKTKEVDKDELKNLRLMVSESIKGLKNHQTAIGRLQFESETLSNWCEKRQNELDSSIKEIADRFFDDIEGLKKYGA